MSETRSSINDTMKNSMWSILITQWVRPGGPLMTQWLKPGDPLMPQWVISCDPLKHNEWDQMIH